MKIIQATMDDLEEVATLFNLYRMFYQQESDLEEAKSFIKKRLENKDSIIFVAKDEEDYIGFTQLYPTFSSVAMKRTWILNDLYVTKKARKQGVGERLLQRAKDLAIETDAKSITLMTAIDNYSAQKWIGYT